MTLVAWAGSAAARKASRRNGPHSLHNQYCANPANEGEAGCLSARFPPCVVFSFFGEHFAYTASYNRDFHEDKELLVSSLDMINNMVEIIPAKGPPMKGHVVQVMKKVGDKWLILEAHPKLFPPPSAK